MKFSKYNNPKRKRHYKPMSRTDADILACKNMIDDKAKGIDLPLSFYDEQSDKMCNQPSRGIY